MVMAGGLHYGKRWGAGHTAQRMQGVLSLLYTVWGVHMPCTAHYVQVHAWLSPIFLVPHRMLKVRWSRPCPRYGIQMCVHDLYRLAQSRSAKQKLKRIALQ